MLIGLLKKSIFTVEIAWMINCSVETPILHTLACINASLQPKLMKYVS